MKRRLLAKQVGRAASSNPNVCHYPDTIAKQLTIVIREKLISNYNFHRTDRHSGRKGGTAVAVRKGIPHNHVDLPPLVTVEATGVCIPIGNSEVLLASVYKSPGRACS
jgi:hypothetical protein